MLFPHSQYFANIWSKTSPHTFRITSALSLARTCLSACPPDWGGAVLRVQSGWGRHGLAWPGLATQSSRGPSHWRSCTLMSHPLYAIKQVHRKQRDSMPLIKIIRLKKIQAFYFCLLFILTFINKIQIYRRISSLLWTWLCGLILFSNYAFYVL